MLLAGKRKWTCGRSKQPVDSIPFPRVREPAYALASEQDRHAPRGVVGHRVTATWRRRDRGCQERPARSVERGGVVVIRLRHRHAVVGIEVDVPATESDGHSARLVERQGRFHSRAERRRRCAGPNGRRGLADGHGDAYSNERERQRRHRSHRRPSRGLPPVYYAAELGAQRRSGVHHPEDHGFIAVGRTLDLAGERAPRALEGAGDGRTAIADQAGGTAAAQKQSTSDIPTRRRRRRRLRSDGASVYERRRFAPPWPRIKRGLAARGPFLGLVTGRD